MEINGTNKDGEIELVLTGAPAGSFVEVRFINTFSGISTVSTVEVKADGTGPIKPPQNFRNNFSITARVLEANSKVVDFTYAPDATAEKIHLVDSAESKAATPTVRPATTTATVAPAPSI